MALLSLNALMPGLTLKTDAANLHGQTVLPAGTQLDENHILLLKSWGIVDVEIEELAPLENQLNPTVDSDQFHQAKAEITQLLSRQDLQSPLIKELVNICAYRKSIRLNPGTPN